MKTRPIVGTALLLMTVALGGGAGIGLVTTQTGCSGQACAIDPFRPDEPTATIECPAGLLCYQGQCIRGCNAGTEKTTACGSDDECDSSRPYCVLSFCSACPEGGSCVQTLNICRRIEVVPEPERPVKPDPNSEKPPYPLVDASFKPEGLRPTRPDSGVGTVEYIPLTHVGYLDVAQTVNIQSGPGSVASVKLQFWNVEGTLVVGFNRWRAEFSPPLAVVPKPIASVDQPNLCEVRRLETSSAAVTIVQADLGQVLIEPHGMSPDASTVKLKADFDAGLQQYVLDMVVPTNLLVYSQYVPFEPRYLAVTGPGITDVTDGAWPDFPPGQSDYLHHVPWELRLTTETETLLRNGIDVGAAPTDIALRFAPFNPNGGTTTGAVPGDRVAFSVVANNIELYCEVVEGTNADTALFVGNGILSQFRTAVGTAGTFPVTFERANKGRPPIDPVAGKAIDMIVSVSHRYRSVIRLQ